VNNAGTKRYHFNSDGTWGLYLSNTSLSESDNGTIIFNADGSAILYQFGGSSVGVVTFAKNLQSFDLVDNTGDTNVYHLKK
jgi:hypothetical protein